LILKITSSNKRKEKIVDNFLMGKQAMLDALEQMVYQGGTDEDILSAAVGQLCNQDDLNKIADNSGADYAHGVSAACADILTMKSAYYASGVASQDPQERAEEIVELAKEAADGELVHIPGYGRDYKLNPSSERVDNPRNTGLRGQLDKLTGRFGHRLQNPAKALALGLGGAGVGGALGVGAGAAGVAGLAGTAALARHLYNKRKAKKQQQGRR